MDGSRYLKNLFMTYVTLFREFNGLNLEFIFDKHREMNFENKVTRAKVLFCPQHDYYVTHMFRLFKSSLVYIILAITKNELINTPSVVIYYRNTLRVIFRTYND